MSEWLWRWLCWGCDGDGHHNSNIILSMRNAIWELIRHCQLVANLGKTFQLIGVPFNWWTQKKFALKYWLRQCSRDVSWFYFVMYCKYKFDNYRRRAAFCFVIGTTYYWSHATRLGTRNQWLIGGISTFEPIWVLKRYIDNYMITMETRIHFFVVACTHWTNDKFQIDWMNRFV